MSLFAISDLHLSLGTDKKMDVFDGWKDYVGLLNKNWRASVTDNDTVVVCGDISWAQRIDEAFEDFNFLNSLPGEKILLKGNHDYWWTSLAKINNFFEKNNFKSFKLLRNNSIEAQGFCICGARGWTTKNMSEHDMQMVNREVVRLQHSFDSVKNKDLEKLVFLHYPPVYFGVESKILDFLSECHIKRCFYGHIHSKDSFKYVRKSVINGVQCELVSCDYLQFKPKLIT